MRRALTTIGLLLAVALPMTAHPGSGIVLDRQGNVIFVDTGSGIWKVDGRGTLTRIPGPAFHWMTIDLDHRFVATQFPYIPGAEIRSTSGDAAMLMSSDFPGAIGGDGAFYYPERGADGRVQVMRLTPAGARSVFVTLPARTDSGPLQWLNGMTTGPDGSIYYTENTAVRRISPRGTLSTIASRVQVAQCARIPGIGPEDGVDLRGLDVAADGTVYVAAAGCGALLKITNRGAVSVLLRIASPWSPTAVALGGGNVYVLEYLHTASDNRREWTPRVRRIAADGKQTIIAAIRR